MYFFGLIFDVVCIVICLLIAKSKGRSSAWCLMGLLGIIGIIVVACIRRNRDINVADKDKINAKTYNDNFKSNTNKRKWKCPSCESINEEGMRFCPNCGRPYSEDYLLEDWVCPVCGRKNPHDSYHCSYCDTERDV